MIIYTRSLKCKSVDVLLVDCGYILGVVPPLMTNPPPVNSPTLHSLSLLGGVLQLNTVSNWFCYPKFPNSTDNVKPLWPT